MSTPAEQIRALGRALDAWADEHRDDTRALLAAFRDAGIAARELGKVTSAQHSAAMKALVDEVGATAAARELGISRGRVYQLLSQQPAE